MTHPSKLLVALALLFTLQTQLATAQDTAPLATTPQAEGEVGVEPSENADETPEDAAARIAFESIGWVNGPATGDLGARAKVETPEGLRFANGDDTRKLMELMQNPVSGNELGIVGSPDLGWFVVFEFDESGYVDDADRDDLDADALLASMREGQEEGNKARRKRGWDTIEIVGWATPPYYDKNSNNLEWATRARSSSGGESINHNSRALGRHGVMIITLVTGAEEYEAVLPGFRSLLTGFQFKSGERYSEFTSGDRVAEYGLTALVAGGIGAAAVKSGLLGKFWKVIVGAVIALGAFVKRIFGSNESKPKRVSKREPKPEPAPASGEDAPSSDDSSPNDASRH